MRVSFSFSSRQPVEVRAFCSVLLVWCCGAVWIAAAPAAPPQPVIHDLTPLHDAGRILINPDKGWYHHYPDNHPDKCAIARDADLLEFPGMDPAGWRWGDFGVADGLRINGGSGNHDRHVRISALNLARLGHLYLNHGRWDGRQLISSNWIRAATTTPMPAPVIRATSPPPTA